MSLPNDLPISKIALLLQAAKLAPLHAHEVLPDGCLRLVLQDGEIVLAQRISETESFALDMLKDQSINPSFFNSNNWALLPETKKIESTPANFSQMGKLLGDMHTVSKNLDLAIQNNLALRDASWFMHQTPHVLALLAEHAENQTPGLLNFAELAQLEEAGQMISELSEPLLGLRVSLLHGNCNLQHWHKDSDDNIVLQNWQSAAVGLPWLDAASLSEDAERSGENDLAEFLREYARAANHELGVLADLLPFVRALYCVFKIDEELLGNKNSVLLEKHARALLNILVP